MSPAVKDRLADLLGATLLVVGLVAMAIVSERWVFVSLWGVAALVAAGWQGERVVVQRGMMLLYLALPLALLARAWPVLTRGIDLSLAFYQAMFLTTVGVLVLAGPRGPGRMARLLFVSGFTLAAAGTDIERDRERYVALVIVWALAALAALRVERAFVQAPGSAAAPGGRTLRPATIAMTLIVVATTIGAVKLLNVYYDQLNRIFYKVMRGRSLASPGGFSGRAELGSIADLQGRQGDTVAVRAFGPRAPGYLRARVFLTYDGGRWTTADQRQAEKRDSDEGRYVVTGRRERDGDPTWRIHPDDRYGAHFFLPLETAVLSETSSAVDVWPGETFASRDGASSDGYGVHAQDDLTPWRPDGEAAAWRALPQHPALLATLDRVLAGRGLAGPITGARDVRLAVQALRTFFAARYRYHVGIDFTKDRDPIEQFLTDEDHGHCELFASAGTLLLRRLGIAARYTTGFVCAERNAWSELYLARNKHAHAWIEVLDPELGWQTVEFTPDSGLPTATPAASGLEAFLNGVGGVYERLKSAVMRFDVKAIAILLLSGVAAVMNWLLAAWWRVVILGALLAVVAGRAWLRRRARVAAATRRLAPDLERERARLRGVERSLARRGLARRPAETLLEWAERLEDAPVEIPRRVETLVFLRDYARRRFGRGSMVGA